MNTWVEEKDEDEEDEDEEEEEDEEDEEDEEGEDEDEEEDEEYFISETDDDAIMLAVMSLPMIEWQQS